MLAPLFFLVWTSVFALFATAVSRSEIRLTLRRSDYVYALLRIAVTPWHDKYDCKLISLEIFI